MALIIPATLAYTISHCVETTIWLDPMKTAEVVPIYKAGKNVCKTMDQYPQLQTLQTFLRKRKY